MGFISLSINLFYFDGCFLFDMFKLDLIKDMLQSRKMTDHLKTVFFGLDISG